MVEIGKFLVDNYVLIFSAITGLIGVFVVVAKLTKNKKDDVIADKAQSFWSKVVEFFTKK